MITGSTDMEGRILACPATSTSRDCYSKARRRAEHPVDQDQGLPVGFTEVGRET